MSTPKNRVNPKKLEALKALLTPLQEVVNIHLTTTYNMWLNGSIPRGAYEYALNRHGSFHTILNFDLEKEITLTDNARNKQFTPIQRLLFCLSPSTINIVEGFDDIPEETKKQAKVNYERLLNFFSSEGFTSTREDSALPQIPSSKPTPC